MYQLHTVRLFQSALTEMRTESLKISMPKFEVRQSIQLTDVLQDMGMTDLFTADADLSGIGDGLYVSAVVHEAYIKVIKIVAYSIIQKRYLKSNNQ